MEDLFVAIGTMPVISGASEGARPSNLPASVAIVVEPLLKPCGQPVVPSQ